MVRDPVPTAISIRVYRHVSQDVCLWNGRFAQELREPAFAERDVLRGRDARTLAREILAMTQEEFSRAFKGSPMKRAKRRGIKRNAAVVLGNVGSADDINVLTSALDDPEPPVCERAAWVLDQLLHQTPSSTSPPKSVRNAPPVCLRPTSASGRVAPAHGSIVMRPQIQPSAW